MSGDGGDRAPAAIVLAAGASSRMGRTKQLLDTGGTSLVRSVAKTAQAAGCAPVLVVVGADAERVRAEVADLGVLIVHNAGWREGIASSLRSGFQALASGVRAAIVLLCDQPDVSPVLLEAMILAHHTSGRSIVACRYDGVTGAPALFARERFAQILALEGDAGARGLIAAAGDDVATVDFPGGAFDLDTPADCERWRARPRG